MELEADPQFDEYINLKWGRNWKTQDPWTGVAEYVLSTDEGKVIKDCTAFITDHFPKFSVVDGNLLPHAEKIRKKLGEWNRARTLQIGELDRMEDDTLRDLTLDNLAFTARYWQHAYLGKGEMFDDAEYKKNESQRSAWYVIEQLAYLGNFLASSEKDV